jgi:hypothetical protein
VVPSNASKEHDIDGAFAALAERRADALLVSTDPYFQIRADQVAALADGRIFEQKGFALEVLVFWSLRGVVLTRPPGINADGHAATLHAAKAEFAARSRHRTCGKVATL